MEKEQFDKLKLITSLTKIGHGNLEEYYRIGLPTVETDSYLFAHLVAWNQKNSKVFDSKIAYPIIALRGDPQFAENAIAHLCTLGPRELIRAYNENKKLSAQGKTIKGKQRKTLQWAIQKYLEIREHNHKWWNSCVVQHRRAMKSLYAISHREPSDYIQRILFKHDYPRDSIFDIIRRLKDMQPKEAAGHIINHKIPITVAIGACSKIKEDIILLSLIGNMSGNELINNTKMLERLKIFSNPVLKHAYDEAVERAKKDKKVNVYKASKAKKQIANEKVANKLITVQKEREKKQKGIEGDWLILGDCSFSMQATIDIARRISALLSSQIKGKVYCIFFNDAPKFFDVTGLSYQEIYDKTKFIVAYGNTAIGCGVDYIMQKNIIVNGIIIVSDGGDNGGGNWVQPPFGKTYRKYADKFMIEPAVYHLWVSGDPNRLTDDYIQKIELDKNFDEYAYSNLLNILKANKYQLLDDIMDTPLLTFDKVFK